MYPVTASTSGNTEALDCLSRGYRPLQAAMWPDVRAGSSEKVLICMSSNFNEYTRAQEKDSSRYHCQLQPAAYSAPQYCVG